MVRGADINVEGGTASCRACGELIALEGVELSSEVVAKPSELEWKETSNGMERHVMFRSPGAGNRAVGVLLSFTVASIFLLGPVTPQRSARGEWLVIALCPLGVVFAYLALMIAFNRVCLVFASGRLTAQDSPFPLRRGRSSRPDSFSIRELHGKYGPLFRIVAHEGSENLEVHGLFTTRPQAEFALGRFNELLAESRVGTSTGYRQGV